MKRSFLPSPCCLLRRSRYSPKSAVVRLLLLWIAVVVLRVGGNDEAATATNGLDVLGGENGTDERVLYSNPQFYTFSADDDTDNDAPRESLEVVGLLFNLRSKLLLGDDEGDGSDGGSMIIRITGLEFHTSVAGNVFYEVRSREGPYYDNVTTGKDGGVGIGAWKSFDLISTGLADGSGECYDQMKKQNESSSRSVNDEGGAPSLFEGDVSPTEGERDAVTSSLGISSCTLAIVPQEDFFVSIGTTTTRYSPWTLVGPNATRSFYVTLASKNLLVSPGDGDGEFDSVVVTSTPDLELYEGVAARTYPLHQNISEYYHEVPVGFIGKIHYVVTKGVPELDGATTEGTSSTLSPMPSISPTTNETETPNTSSPTEFGETRAPEAPTAWPTANPTYAPITGSPTPKPTKRCRPGRPCLAPPAPKAASEPTMSPLISSSAMYTIELMVYIEGVPERTMLDREEEEYTETMEDFLKSNKDLRRAGVNVMSVDIFYQNVYLDKDGNGAGGKKYNPDAVEKRMLKGSGGEKGGRGPGNQTEVADDEVSEPRNSTKSYTYNYNTESDYAHTGIETIYVMTHVNVVTKLPYNVASFFVWDVLRLNEAHLIHTFISKALFVSYFNEVKGIIFEVHEDLTAPPTPSPTREADAVLDGLLEDESDNVGRGNVYATVGIALVIVWMFLTICGLKQILKHRRKAKQRIELKKVTRMTTANVSLQPRKQKETVGSVLMALGKPTILASESREKDDAARKNQKRRSSAGESVTESRRMRRSGRGGHVPMREDVWSDDGTPSTADETGRTPKKSGRGRRTLRKEEVDSDDGETRITARRSGQGQAPRRGSFA